MHMFFYITVLDFDSDITFTYEWSEVCSVVCSALWSYLYVLLSVVSALWNTGTKSVYKQEQKQSPALNFCSLPWNYNAKKIARNKWNIFVWHKLFFYNISQIWFVLNWFSCSNLFQKLFSLSWKFSSKFPYYLLTYL